MDPYFTSTGRVYLTDLLETIETFRRVTIVIPGRISSIIFKQISSNTTIRIQFRENTMRGCSTIAIMLVIGLAVQWGSADDMFQVQCITLLLECPRFLCCAGRRILGRELR